MYMYNVYVCMYSNAKCLYITGVDYHFEINELYLTLTDKIQRYDVSVTETGTGTLEIALLNMNSETLYTAPSGNTLGSITIDWVYNITYWIEFEGSTTKVTVCAIIKTTNNYIYMYLYMFGPGQLSCLGSSVGRALCLEY